LHLKIYNYQILIIIDDELRYSII